MPIDKVVDDVAAMGFERNVVREVVNTLTANGQSVDLNVVLDKLMNGDTGSGGGNGNSMGYGRTFFRR